MKGSMESGCTCQGCFKIYTVDLIVPNEIWENIKPRGKPRGSGLLCPKCIGKRIEKINGFSTFELKELK